MITNNKYELFYVRTLGAEQAVDVFLAIIYNVKRSENFMNDLTEISITAKQTKNDTSYKTLKESAMYEKRVEIWKINLSKQDNNIFEAEYAQGYVNEWDLEEENKANGKITIHGTPQTGKTELPDNDVEFIKTNIM